MKRVSILFLLGAIQGVMAVDPLVISNNAYVAFVGDSIYAVNSDGSGARFVSFWQSAQAGMHPNNVIFVYDNGHSGATKDVEITNDLPASVGFMGMFSNNNQHILIDNATDNGSISSNSMYLAESNVCLFPGISTANSAFPLTSSTGWMATHPFQIICSGYIPANASDGSPATEGQRSGAGAKSAQAFGFLGYDFWLDRILVWTNNIVNSNAVDIQYNATGHVYDGGSWDQFIDLWRRTTPSDTNVANSVVDFASGTVTSTNNCVVSSITKNGSSISFNRLDNSIAPGFFVPTDDGSITNDTRHAFNLDPVNASFFNFGVCVTGLPTGIYNVSVDGVNIASISSAELARGWNMFTNTTGPFWNQRNEVLMRVLDWRYVDHKTLIPRSPADGVGEVSFGSFTGVAVTAGNRGDNLIAAMNARALIIQTNFLPQYPQSIYASAQTTNHEFTFTLVNYAAAPFRP